MKNRERILIINNKREYYDINGDYVKTLNAQGI